MKIAEEYLRAIIRQTIAESPRRKYLYHSSPSSEIEEFHPRPFMHNENFSSSGLWVSSEPPPPGFKVSNLVFTGSKSSTPFYSLPRDAPRILAYIDNSASGVAVLNILLKYADIPALSRKKIFILSAEDRRETENHTWTEYGFNVEDFSPLDGGLEYVSSKSIRPIFKKRHKNPLRYVKNFGYEVVFVPNIAALQQIKAELKDVGIAIDTEALA